MSDSNKIDYDNLVSKGLISDEAQKEYLKRLQKLQNENKTLENSTKERKKKNENFIKSLPKGFTFSIGSFEITT
jgi:hypothetical protein